MTPEQDELIEEGLEMCPCNPCDAWSCQEVRLLWEEVKRLRAACYADGSPGPKEGKMAPIPTVEELLRDYERQNMEIEQLKLRIERDQSAYALMQKGMESQAELMHGMKQELRELRAAYKELMAETE